MILEIIRIKGVSMAPTFSDGDYVVVLSDQVCARPPVLGSVVVVRHPMLGILVKRVLEVKDNGCIRVGGDNPMSVSSHSLGSLDSADILGRVLLTIPKSGFPRLVGCKAA